MNNYKEGHNLEITIGSPKSEVLSPKLEVGSLKSEVWSLNSEGAGKSEVRGPFSATLVFVL